MKNKKIWVIVSAIFIFALVIVGLSTHYFNYKNKSNKVSSIYIDSINSVLEIGDYSNFDIFLPIDEYINPVDNKKISEYIKKEIKETYKNNDKISTSNKGNSTILIKKLYETKNTYEIHITLQINGRDQLHIQKTFEYVNNNWTATENEIVTNISNDI